jgi:hypothetical protein
LLRRGGAGQFDVWKQSDAALWLQSAAEENRTIYAKVVERAGNLDLGLEIEVGIGELLALT